MNLPIVSLTQAGKQSRIVSLTKRFARADGDILVAELIKCAKAINARDELLCGVSELRLFGSMLDPKRRRSAMLMSRIRRPISIQVDDFMQHLVRERCKFAPLTGLLT